VGFDFIEKVAERKIQEAIEEGKFDNLPGKGQPINLDDDPMTPPHLRLANKILKNAGVLPDWMQIDQELDRSRKECEQVFARLLKEYPRRRNRAQVAGGTQEERQRRRRQFTEWLGRERSGYIRMVKQINTDITKLNLIAPSVPRVHVPINVGKETERFDAAFPSLDGTPPPAPQDAVKEDGEVRMSAAALYQIRSRKG
jgi:DnaJ homolog subfamily C member 28